MTISSKKANEMARETYLNEIMDYFRDHDEVLRVKSNEIAIPIVDCNDEEKFIVITVKVPTGANKGLEPYDGYAMAEDYEHALAEKAEKAKKKAEAKERKMKRDAEIRRKRAEIAEKSSK